MTFTESENNTGERQGCFIQKEIDFHSDLKVQKTRAIVRSKTEGGVNECGKRIINKIKVTGRSF
jgi:hypothetical protein